MNLVTVAAYQFIPLTDLPILRARFKAKCLELTLKGTVLIAPEGLNYFVSGTTDQIEIFKDFVVNELGFSNLCYKENICFESPFNRMLVKIKKEIIPMGDPSIRPDIATAPYIKPSELKSWIDEGKDIVLLDTRNKYEVDSGTFKNAMHLGLDSFREFPEASQKLPEEMKEKVVVMFCTGGIRCEKASAYFMNSGFQKVYQLEGGILQYFEDCGGAHYDGNCFVFDWRLSVDSQLQPQSRSSSEPASGRHIPLK